MNTASKKNLINSIATLVAYDISKHALHKIANAQGPNDQEENALWCDFYECLQDSVKATMGVELPDLTQDMVERSK